MPDPLAAARARGARYLQDILRGPDMLPEHEALAVLDVTPAALAHMRATHQVLALPDGSRFKYPIWQFDRARQQVWPGLHEVLVILKNPWRALRWLQKAEPFLQDEQPIHVLREGQIVAELRAARWYDGNQGAHKGAYPVILPAGFPELNVIFTPLDSWRNDDTVNTSRFFPSAGHPLAPRHQRGDGRAAGQAIPE